MDFCVPETEDIVFFKNMDNNIPVQSVNLDPFTLKDSNNIILNSSFLNVTGIFTLQSGQLDNRFFYSEDKTEKLR